MIRLLLLSLVFALFTPLEAGVTIDNHQDDDLAPADFVKYVIVAPIPGTGDEPWQIDDPDIIIDDDGPSDEDEGLIYVIPTYPRPCDLPTQR
jgi:hypothetical protein